MGPRWRISGSHIPATWWVPIDSSSRFSTRYEAKNTTRTIFDSSPGWKVTGPNFTHRREPLMFWPSTGRRGMSSRPMPNEGEGVAEALDVAGAGDEGEGGDEGADADHRPHRLEAGQVGPQAGDEHVADAVEQPGQGQEEGVGAGGQPAHGQVGRHQQPQDDQQEGDEVGGQRRAAAEGGEHVGPAGDHPGQHQQPQLGRPADGDHRVSLHQEGGSWTGGGGGGAVVVGGVVVVVVRPAALLLQVLVAQVGDVAVGRGLGVDLLALLHVGQVDRPAPRPG